LTLPDLEIKEENETFLFDQENSKENAISVLSELNLKSNQKKINAKRSYNDQFFLQNCSNIMRLK
jgi:hypothetical protein